jgi:tripartite-type tricarboxylate transporter receptor subunit TctC
MNDGDKMDVRERWISKLAVAVLTLAMGSAWGQSYPMRPVRIIEAFPPGGGTDFAARIIAQKLTDVLGQQVIVENRTGAAGSIGTEAAARATPDGHTLLLANNATLAINPSLYRKLPYDPTRDFAPVTLVASYGYIVVVRPALPVKTLADLAAYAKLNPGKLNFASAGSTTRVAGALFRTVGGMQMTDVPYNGTGPAVIDLLGGHVDLMLASTPLAQFKTGALRPLAVTGSKRSPVLPELPTVAEAGMPGLETSAWYGVVVPVAVPAQIVAKLNADIVSVLRQNDVRERLGSTGAEIIGSSPQEFAALIRAEVAKWAKVVKESGIPVQ